MRTLLSLMLFTLSLSAADWTGKWSGTTDFKAPDGSTESGGAYAVLKQDGKAVTGTAGPSEEEQVAVENGKIDGKVLTFQVNVPGDAGPRVFKVSLTMISDDQVEGDIEGTANDGQKITGKLKMSRQKGA